MALARLPSACLQPGHLTDEELFWHWRRSLVPLFDCVPISDPDAPAHPLKSTQYHVGEFLFVDAEYPQQRFVRDAAWVRRHDDADHVLLQVFLRGRNTGINGDSAFVEEAGGVFAVNLGYETDATSSGADTMSLVLPRDWLAERLPSLRDASGAVFAKDSMASRLFTDFLLSLRRNLPNATVADAPVISRALVGLLGPLLSRDDPTAVEAQTGAFLAVQRYIDGNLGDPGLGADSLCAHFRMSRATLFRLFKDQGGVRSYIQRRRLMACFRALSSPREADRLIYDVGLDFGFTSPSHMSTLFRQHFGMLPREIREASRYRGHNDGAVPETAGLPDAEVMRRWALDLGSSSRPDGSRDGPAGTAGIAGL